MGQIIAQRGRLEITPPAAQAEFGEKRVTYRVPYKRTPQVRLDLQLAPADLNAEIYRSVTQESRFGFAVKFRCAIKEGHRSGNEHVFLAWNVEGEVDEAVKKTMSPQMARTVRGATVLGALGLAVILLANAGPVGAWVTRAVPHILSRLAP